MSLNAAEFSNDGPDTLVLQIHSNLVSSPRELWRELQTRLGAGNFEVEMRHDLYTIQVNRARWNTGKADLVRRHRVERAAIL
jgi:hypothetical protein